MPPKRKTGPVTARTAARRARKRAAAESARPTGKKTPKPETTAQARVWSRKKGRYLLAGLCEADATAAANGHAKGFQHLDPPCKRCQPIVNAFPTPGPKGSPWRKLLIRIEYLKPEPLAEFLATLPEPADEPAGTTNGEVRVVSPSAYVPYDGGEKTLMESLTTIRTLFSWLVRTGRPLEEYPRLSTVSPQERIEAVMFATNQLPRPAKWTLHLYAVAKGAVV